MKLPEIPPKYRAPLAFGVPALLILLAIPILFREGGFRRVDSEKARGGALKALAALRAEEASRQGTPMPRPSSAERLEAPRAMSPLPRPPQEIISAAAAAAASASAGAGAGGAGPGSASGSASGSAGYAGSAGSAGSVGGSGGSAGGSAGPGLGGGPAARGGGGGPDMGGSAGPASYQGGQMGQVQGYGWNKPRLKASDSAYGARAIGGGQQPSSLPGQNYGGTPAGGGPMGGGGPGLAGGGSAIGGGAGGGGGGGGSGGLGGGDGGSLGGLGGGGAGTANPASDGGSTGGVKTDNTKLDKCNRARDQYQGQIDSLSGRLQELGQKRHACGSALEGDVGCYNCNSQQWGWWQTWCRCAANRCSYISTCNQMNGFAQKIAVACEAQAALQNCSQ